MESLEKLLIELSQIYNILNEQGRESSAPEYAAIISEFYNGETQLMQYQPYLYSLEKNNIHHILSMCKREIASEDFLEINQANLQFEATPLALLEANELIPTTILQLIVEIKVLIYNILSNISINNSHIAQKLVSMPQLITRILTVNFSKFVSL